MFRRILVPLDGSTFGEHALPMAMSIARRAKATLELVHVYPSLEEFDEPQRAREDHDRGRREARAYLDQAIERLSAGTSVPCEATVLEGRTAEQLLGHAQRTSPDLVVMTTHGRGPLSRLWLGSVADAMVREAAMPLLLIRPSDEAPDYAADPAPRRILVPLDGSAFAEQVIEPAIALGKLADAEYRLLRVVQLAVTTGEDPWFGPPMYAPDADLMSHAESYLRRVRERLETQYSVTVDANAATAFNPATAILEDAEQHQAGLIALATRGRSGVSRVLLGSVADKVLRGASVPVLMYRPSNSE